MMKKVSCLYCIMLAVKWMVLIAMLFCSIILAGRGGRDNGYLVFILSAYIILLPVLLSKNFLYIVIKINGNAVLAQAKRFADEIIKAGQSSPGEGFR